MFQGRQSVLQLRQLWSHCNELPTTTTSSMLQLQRRRPHRQRVPENTLFNLRWKRFVILVKRGTTNVGVRTQSYGLPKSLNQSTYEIRTWKETIPVPTSNGSRERNASHAASRRTRLLRRIRLRSVLNVQKHVCLLTKDKPVTIFRPRYPPGPVGGGYSGASGPYHQPHDGYQKRY